MYLGIEIGGTKLQLGVGRGDGTLAGLWRGSVDVAAGAEGIRTQILAAVPELLGRSRVERGQLRGVGIGFGGPVDDATRSVIKSHQIQGWDNFPLADWIGRMLDLPAVLGNDADVAGLAEALHGAGKGLSPIFYITIGSGIGGGLIINGEIYRGCGRGAAELGHLLVATQDEEGRTRFRPLEQLASGWGIAAHAKLRARETLTAESLLHQMIHGDLEAITAQRIAQAAEQGDDWAFAVLSFPLHCLASAIAEMAKLLCPRRIIIGGGVGLMSERVFYARLRTLVGRLIFPPFADCYDIVPAALGVEVVVHGALALARKKVAGEAAPR